MPVSGKRPNKVKRKKTSVRAATTSRKLIRGDYPALRASFLSEVEESRAKDRLCPLIILVTSHLLGLSLQRYLADKGQAHLNIRFLTLEDLARHVAMPRLEAEGKREAAQFGPEQIIRSTATGIAAEDTGFYFRAIADRSGFYQALLSTIGDLKNAGLSPSGIRATLDDASTEKGINRAKLMDFLRVWDAYEAELQRLNWFDEYDLMKSAAELLPPSLLMQHTSAVMTYGFYDFNFLERQLLRACCEIVDTICFVPYEATPAFDYAKPTMSWLTSLGFREVQAPRHTPPSNSPAVTHLCRHLFSKGAEVAGSQSGITLISAPGELRETREAIRELLRGCESGLIGPYEIGILLRNPSVYADLFRETFESLDLKPYIPEGIALKDTRSGRSLLLMLDILKHDFARRAVMEFVTFARLPDVERSPEGKSHRSAIWWDAISMEAGIVGGANEWDGRLGRLLDDLRRRSRISVPDTAQTPPGKIDAVISLRRFMKRLGSYLLAVERATSWTEKALNLIDAFAGIVEEDDNTTEVKNAVKQLGGLDQLGLAPSSSAFAEMVNRALGTSAGPIGKFERNGPAVLDLMASRGIQFRVVVIPGMVEKEFPPVLRQDAIILDGERASLNKVLTGSEIDPIPLKARRRLEEEHLLFRLAVGAAGERLVLTYPRLEIATARERLPSSLLLAAVQAFSGKRIGFESIQTFEGYRRIPLAQIAPEMSEEALDSVEYDLAIGIADAKHRRTDYLRYLQAASPIFRLALKLEGQRWGSKALTCYDGLLSNQDARQRLRTQYSISGQTVSPTRLETYATCPFRFLMASILGLESLVEPERIERISALDKGNLVHSILCEFLTTLKTERGVPVKIDPEDGALLHRIAAARFDDFETRGTTGFPAMWAVDKQEIIEWLDRFLEEEIGQIEFLPAYFEVCYGMKAHEPLDEEISTEEPVSLAFKGRKMLFRGRIDRIDISCDHSRARVIDYKTGKAYASDNEFDQGRSLQLPLYLHAAHHLLKGLHGDMKTESAAYYHLALSGKKRYIRFDRDTLDSKSGELASILGTIADSIESGLFFAVPGDHCATCDFLLICGSYRHSLFGLKAEDQNINKFLGLGGEKEA